MNKKTKRPNLKPGGPGRGHKNDDKPRVTDPGKTVAAGPGKAAGGQPAAARADYSEDLAGLGMSVWMAGSALQGGQLPLLKIRGTGPAPYAYVWHDQLPRGVAAWNAAAQQNATVRGWVEKLAGEGSWQWVFGVGIWGANLPAGFQELRRRTTRNCAEGRRGQRPDHAGVPHRPDAAGPAPAAAA